MHKEQTNSMALMLLAFWACWLLLSASSNLSNALSLNHLLPMHTAFNSHNFALILNDTHKYQLPPSIAHMLLYLDIAMGMALSILFFRASWHLLRRDAVANKAISLAFRCLLAYWFCFMLADEFFIDYTGEHVHVLFCMLGILSYFVVNNRETNT